MRNELDCIITDQIETLSGKPHRIVQRSDGDSFFLDASFLFALRNINRQDLERKLCLKFEISSRAAREIVSTIKKTRLVKETEEAPADEASEQEKAKPRVGILTERMKMGFGVDLVVHETAKRLKARGYDVAVFTGSVDPIYASVDYRLVQLGDGDRLADVFSQQFFERAVRQLREHDRDVWLVESLPFYYWRESLQGPVIFIEHGTPSPEFFPKKVSLAVRMAKLLKRERVFKAIRGCDRIVVISEFIAAELPGEVSERTSVVHNGCDHYPKIEREAAKSLRERLGVRDTDFLMTYIGRIDFDGERQPYKCVDRLIDVYRRVHADMPEVKLLLVGRSDTVTKEQLQKMNVLSMLNASETDVARALAAADLFVSMSLWEGFDLPLFESQFQGTPCVVMRRGAHPELIDGTGSGILASNEAEFEREIRRLVNDRSLIVMMGEAALRNAAKFSWDSNVDGLESVIEDAIEEAGDAAGLVRLRPPSNFRFGLTAASEILMHEGLLTFLRVAAQKFKRMWARR
ncbi:glycosyltransferase family 4 protein [bacterium]|nr:glycosyltransferase family 4 protein [bacterium]